MLAPDLEALVYCTLPWLIGLKVLDIGFKLLTAYCDIKEQEQESQESQEKKEDIL